LVSTLEEPVICDILVLCDILVSKFAFQIQLVPLHRGPRVSFLIVPSDKAGPNPTTSAWQYFVAIALFGRVGTYSLPYYFAVKTRFN
jgi:hypothetical protein